MTERIDHRKRAEGLIASIYGKRAEGLIASIYGKRESPVAIQSVAVVAQAEATLAFVEQQRIANLIALANSHHPVLVGQVATDAADALTEWHSHDDSEMGGWSELRPEVAAVLGVGKEQDA